MTPRSSVLGSMRTVDPIGLLAPPNGLRLRCTPWRASRSGRAFDKFYFRSRLAWMIRSWRLDCRQHVRLRGHTWYPPQIDPKWLCRYLRRFHLGDCVVWRRLLRRFSSFGQPIDKSGLPVLMRLLDRVILVLQFR